MPRISPTPTKGRAKIALVGEAPGREEDLLGVPFVGESGKELTRMLADAGLSRDECYLTNVLLDRPPENKLEAWCVNKLVADRLYRDLHERGPYPYPPVAGAGKYLHPERLFELERLRDELESVRPNLVLALGNTASWALLGRSGIGQIRGTISESTLCPGLKVLPTYHPAAILRQWKFRAITVMDLMKAKLEAEFPDIRRPRRQVWLEPTLEDLEEFYERRILGGTGPLAIDIETEKRHITCVGFAPSPDVAIVVPFWDKRKTGWSYWSPSEEVRAWAWVRRILFDPNIPKVLQNGAYDLQYLWRVAGTPVFGRVEDTMLMHHALQPELQKGLGFLGSIYTSEPAWKLMRKRSGEEPEKREE